MPKAIAKAGDIVIAESDDTVVVEGKHYFPISDIKKGYLKDSDLHTVCSWKGEATYKHIEADGQIFENAAFIYLEPKTERAEAVRDRMAFWQGVEVKEKQ